MIRRTLALLLTPPDSRRVERLEAQNTALRRENATLHKLSALLSGAVARMQVAPSDDPIVNAHTILDSLQCTREMAEERRLESETANARARRQADKRIDAERKLAAVEADEAVHRAVADECHQLTRAILVKLGGNGREGSAAILPRIATVIEQWATAERKLATADAEIVKLSDLAAQLDKRVGELSEALNAEQWVPIGERLPEHLVPVLFATNGDPRIGYWRRGSEDGGEFMLFVREGLSPVPHRFVRAWRPIPAYTPPAKP